MCKLGHTLFDRYKVWTVAINSASAGVHGVRVTPLLYTATAELDVPVNALLELAGQ